MDEELFAVVNFLCYNINMRNWFMNDKHFANNNEKAIWQLEQMVNFGLARGEKLNKKQLLKFWDNLSLDPSKKKFLQDIIPELWTS